MSIATGRVGTLKTSYADVAYYVPKTPSRVLVLAHGYPWADGTQGITRLDRARSWVAAMGGGQVKKIGLMSAEDAYAAVRTLVSVDAENESRRRLLAANLLLMPEVLQAIGATSTANRIDLTVEKEGRETTTTLSAEPFGPWSDPGWPVAPQSWVDAKYCMSNTTK